jgi:hypothetical protein
MEQTTTSATEETMVAAKATSAGVDARPKSRPSSMLIVSLLALSVCCAIRWVLVEIGMSKERAFELIGLFATAVMTAIGALAVAVSRLRSLEKRCADMIRPNEMDFSLQG